MGSDPKLTAEVPMPDGYAMKPPVLPLVMMAPAACSGVFMVAVVAAGEIRAKVLVGNVPAAGLSCHVHCWATDADPLQTFSLHECAGEGKLFANVAGLAGA